MFVVGVGRRQRATLYGGLLTTIQTLSKQSLAMHPSYIEYGQGTLPSTSLYAPRVQARARLAQPVALQWR
jgi:hypothetical protein